MGLEQQDPHRTDLGAEHPEQTSRGRPRRPYRKPALIEFGNVRSLTLGGVGSKKEPRTQLPRPK